MKKDITLILGTTAIGKSDYAIALAEETNAEIISADAFQVYRYMDIGTAKISPEEQNLIPHHLINIKNPDEDYSVAEFVSLAQKKITEIRKQQKNIIICGGTAFYLYAFLYNYDFPQTNKKETNIRQSLVNELESIGSEAFWQKLNQIDPATAKNIEVNDSKKLIRSLEIYQLTGELPSNLRKKTELPRPDVKLIGLTASRELIYERINQRVDKMITAGLIEEVRNLLDMGYDSNLKAFEALGYKETIQYLQGSIGLAEMIELIKRKTRNFAKRQLTWYRRFNDVQWIEIY